MVNQRDFDVQPGYCKYNANVNGNTDNYIFNTGSPGLDWLTRAKLLSKQELQQRVSINLNKPFIVACFHPVTRELEDTARQMDNFLYVIGYLNEQVLLIRPNCDPCNEQINELIDITAKLDSNVKVVSNLDHLTYLSMLQYALLMVGNSSSGIIESASFNIPSVTVGNRQDGRIKASNTFSCPCETDAILTAIDRAREWNATVGKCDNPYGDGKSSKRIVEVLENV